MVSVPTVQGVVVEEAVDITAVGGEDPANRVLGAVAGRRMPIRVRYR